MKRELEIAYRATRYVLNLPEGACVLRVDQCSPRLAEWLQARKMHSFSVLTAFNPASRLLSPEENVRRQAVLLAQLEGAGRRVLTGRNLPENAAAFAEDSVCVFNLTLTEALAIGRKYGQNALLFGGESGIPRLCWIDGTSE